MLNIENHPNTVYVLVGPTGCGKSTLVHRLATLGQAAGERHAILSSDTIRATLLGMDSPSKYDPRMMQVSAQAFDVLYSMLEAHMRYPLNTYAIYVDTMGLSAQLRKHILARAKAHNYRVEALVFDYKDESEYFPEGAPVQLIHRKLHTLKHDVLPVIKREGFHAVHYVRSHEDVNSAFMPVWTKPATYPIKRTAYSYTVASQKDWLVVGDVHGCLDELKELIRVVGERRKCETLPLEIALVGDIIDKGPQIADTIHWVYDSPNVHVIRGNHENFVYKYMHGQIQEDSLPDAETMKMFNTIELLKADTELARQFDEIYAQSIPFLNVEGMFIATHAPCHKNQLGKWDPVSLREQRVLRLPHARDYAKPENYHTAVTNALRFMQEEDQMGLPLHIYGHIPHARGLRLKSSICLDHGCVEGGELLGVLINRHGHHVVSVPSKQPKQGALPVIDFAPALGATLEQFNALPPRARGRIRAMAEKGVNYVSGTMSPVDKNEQSNQLESVNDAVAYYRQHGVAEVVLQPKYMGSRCQVYLHRDPEKCYAVSRNGYRIDHVDLSLMFRELRTTYADMFVAEPKLEIRVLDGELLPWAVLGKDLIDRSFTNLIRSARAEMLFLQMSGYAQEFQAANSRYDASGFNTDVIKTPKAEMIKKYGQGVYTTGVALRDTSNINPNEQLELISKFEAQVQRYGGEGTPHYMPFYILKDVMSDGTEIVYDNANNHEVFSRLNPETVKDGLCIRVVTADSPELNTVLESFFNRLTAELGFEGVVVKPLWAGTQGVVPYLKVRNPEYLRITYGFDYTLPKKYSRIMREKRVAMKQRLSISEWNYGMAMLRIPLAQLTTQFDQYAQVATALTQEIEKEKACDPRL